MTSPNPQPSDYKELLEVFRVGLIQDIVLKQQIIAWTDEIIIQTPEPDYLFIELSLCRNKSVNDIIKIIGHIPDVQTSAITIRVLFGLLYHKLIAEKTDIEKIILKIYGLNNHDHLTPFECGFIYQLKEDYNLFIGESKSAEWEWLTADTLNFLTYYKGFELSNYENWAEVNQQVLEVLTIETAQEKELINTYARQSIIEQSPAKRRYYLKETLFYIIALTPFLLMFLLAVKFRKYIFRDDLLITVVSVLLMILITTFRIIIKRTDQ